MADPHAVNHDTVSPYRCSSCSRCFVACGEGVGGEILCMCGARLVERPLPRGIYELKSPVAEHVRATNPGGLPSQPRPKENEKEKEKEADLGYGASHGYAPGHEGPSGPGDVPAKPARPS